MRRVAKEPESIERKYLMERAVKNQSLGAYPTRKGIRVQRLESKDSGLEGPRKGTLSG